MKRSLLIFHRYHLSVTPLPAGFRSSDRTEITPYTFLPSASALADTVTALREHLGSLFYRLILPNSEPERTP
jgi:uncharacterized SAM-binding protein YcdF (DUF218 family)